MATVRVGTPLYFLSCATPLSDAELVPVLPKTASGSPSDFQIIVVVLFNEGSLVRITGFLATGPLKPHANTGESVNRRIKKPANNDFHISLVETAQGTEFEGVVVEMIPQDRPAGWTLAKLGKVQQQRQRVLVTGALFYDNEHFINPDPNNDMNGQPRRFALWEVHPITKFQVCGNASGNCDPNTASDWTELESLH